MGNRPGGELAKRPLQFIWLVDCSGSMRGKKIESVTLVSTAAQENLRNVSPAAADQGCSTI